MIRDTASWWMVLGAYRPDSQVRYDEDHDSDVAMAIGG
jgi:hypothetical protein